MPTKSLVKKKMFTTDLFIIARIPGNSEMPMNRRTDKQWYMYIMGTIQQESTNNHVDETEKYTHGRC